MSDRRFDKRTQAQFAKDIMFGTKIEEFWMKTWIEELKHWPDYELLSATDYGVDNSGAYVETSNGNADFYVKYYKLKKYYEHPLEVKWAPANDKATFKIADLQNYVEQNASILLIFNMSEHNLKRPKGYNHEKHLQLITSMMEHVQWGIIEPANISKIMRDYKHFNIKYMGNKLGLIVPSEDFDKYTLMKEMRHAKVEKTDEL